MPHLCPLSSQRLLVDGSCSFFSCCSSSSQRTCRTLALPLICSWRSFSSICCVCSDLTLNFCVCVCVCGMLTELIMLEMDVLLVVDVSLRETLKTCCSYRLLGFNWDSQCVLVSQCGVMCFPSLLIMSELSSTLTDHTPNNGHIWMLVCRLVCSTFSSWKLVKLVISTSKVAPSWEAAADGCIVSCC